MAVTAQELTDDIKDRIRGAILGAACGSALGGSCVGLNHKEILATAGISVLRDFVPGLTRSLLPEHKPGELLADAQLGLTLAESLIASSGRLDEGDLRSRWQDLLEGQTFLRAGASAYCLASLRRMVDGQSVCQDGEESVHVSGAARAFPIGCLPDSPDSKDCPDRAELARAQARLTQGDASVAAASAVLANSIHSFIVGERIDTEEEVRVYVARELELARNVDERFADFWDDVAPDLDYSRPASEIPYSLANVQPSVNEAIPSAVGVFLIFRHDLEEAICAAARVGGITDSVATVVGALSGAYHGASKIPERWLSAIDQKDRLDSICNGLIDLWQ